MNNDLKGNERKLSWPKTRYHPDHSERDCGKPRKTSAKIAGVPAEDRTYNLMGMSEVPLC
jgi:hypothetical protein